ncbi:MAG: hypothetical protein RIQ52_1497 [Pseudomonadota bacterium]|jgi:4-hydroxy-3-polyprenylbenzoate decarboxylase
MSLVAQQKKRLVLGMTGATGAIYGLRLLEIMRDVADWETHVVISDAGALNIQHELGMKRRELHALADVVHDISNVGASIASGAFRTDAMIVAPCSMRTLAAIAHGLSDNLLTRAADVTLKERRRLLIMPRETPLNLAHIRNMGLVTEMGGIVFPPMPAFYGRSKTVGELVDESVGRILELVNVPAPSLFAPWEGLTPGDRS